MSLVKPKTVNGAEAQRQKLSDRAFRAEIHRLIEQHPPRPRRPEPRPDPLVLASFIASLAAFVSAVACLMAVAQ